MFIYFIGVIIVMLVGLGLFFGSRLIDSHEYNLTKTEFIVGVILVSFVVLPLTTFAGTAIAKGSALSYNEYWSGLEVSADVQVTKCSKDGPCVHEYNCDPYVVMVTKTRQVPYTATETDANGNMRTVTKYRTETYQEPETRYHDCPYVTEEYTYTVTDSMDEKYTLGSHWFPSNPEDHRWSGFGYNDPAFGFGRPGLPNVPSGQPATWKAAKARIDSGNPGGTTKRHSYDNYILASTEDIYEQASSAIDSYLAEDLMPVVTTKIRDEYLADKVYFMGVQLDDAADWQEEVQRFNGYLGSERQGDMHVVIVDASQVTDPDEYSQAVEAYWQSDIHGDDVLSKNGIGVVLGLNNGTVEWSRGFTGMPLGNEAMVQEFNSLAATDATPAALFARDGGAVANIVFADGAGFERVEMASYEYLKDSVKISGWAMFWTLFVGILLSLIMWGIFLAVDVRFHVLENLFSKENS